MKTQSIVLLGMLVLVSFSGHANEGDDAMAKRNQALRQQHARAGELFRQHGAQPNASAVTRKAINPAGAISLSSQQEINQQLVQGMNDARSGLKAIKAAAPSGVLEQQRDAVALALEQAVQAYLQCRSEAKAPLQSDYNSDAYLREMIAIKHNLLQKSLNVVAVDEMLSQLAAARNILVGLTVSKS